MTGGAPDPDVGGASSRSNPRGGGPAKWLTWIALVFLAEVALIFALGQKHFPPARKVAPKDVPHLALINGSDELIALADPTLFVLPHTNDFVWMAISHAPAPGFEFAEPLRPLPLAAASLGTVFSDYMRTNSLAVVRLDFKPEANVGVPLSPPPPQLPDSSTLEVAGNLAARPLLNANRIHWPTLVYDDILPPSKVLALVDNAGDVVSAVLLPPENPADLLGRANIGDTNAVAIVRGLQFAPGSRPTVGVVIFHWLTVPTPSGAKLRNLLP